MARYTPDSKERIRDAVDLGDLIGQYTELRRASTTSLKGLCPFHEERTPSFNVDPSKGFFKCFGCGEGGDLFRFVELKEGLDFKGALEWLADRYGIQLELEEEDPRAAAARKGRERLLELLDRTATFYARYLWDSTSPEAVRAREYLRGRGLDEDLLREFRVGMSPKRWDTVLLASRRAGYSEQELLDAGLCSRSQRTGGLLDRFRGRVMFPLADRRGRVNGFGARRLTDDDVGPKYLNSNDGDLFHKGQNLYAADLARATAAKAGVVLLAEGYTDVIALHQAGLRNTVGLMGTALTEQQVVELARLAPVVLLALDADGAGQEAMLRAAKVAAGQRLELRVVPLPSGKDPADVVLGDGAPAMRALVETSVPFVRFRVERELSEHDLDSAEGKDRVIEALRPVFASIPPSAVREELLKLVADRTDLQPAMVASWLSRPAGRPVGGSAMRERQAPPPARGPTGSGRGDGRPWAGPDGGPGPDRSGAPEDERATPRPAPVLPPSAAVRAERGFLVQCYALPDRGRELLATMDLDAAFALPVHQRAARALLAGDRSLPDDDPELGSLVAGLALRAGEIRASPITLDFEHLKLRLAEVDRRMAVARRDGSGDVATLAGHRRDLQQRIDDVYTQAIEESTVQS